MNLQSNYSNRLVNILNCWLSFKLKTTNYPEKNLWKKGHWIISQPSFSITSLATSLLLPSLLILLQFHWDFDNGFPSDFFNTRFRVFFIFSKIFTNLFLKVVLSLSINGHVYRPCCHGDQVMSAMSVMRITLNQRKIQVHQPIFDSKK